MSDEDRSIDLTGFGKLAKAIPASSWKELVSTACVIFRDVLSPLIATTTGLGRLIEAKFQGMVDAQKILAADTVRKARDKVEKTNRVPMGSPKSVVLIRSIERASIESDENIRDIWASLIANEILDNEVHPEFPRILERLSPRDAITLAEIAKPNKKKAILAAANALLTVFPFSSRQLLEPSGFSEEHLNYLNLVKRVEGVWRLTSVGEEFLKCVSDPSFEYIEAEQSTSTDADKPRR